MKHIVLGPKKGLFCGKHEYLWTCKTYQGYAVSNQQPAEVSVRAKDNPNRTVPSTVFCLFLEKTLQHWVTRLSADSGVSLRKFLSRKKWHNLHTHVKSLRHLSSLGCDPFLQCFNILPHSGNFDMSRVYTFQENLP